MRRRPRRDQLLPGSHRQHNAGVFSIIGVDLDRSINLVDTSLTSARGLLVQRKAWLFVATGALCLTLTACGGGGAPQASAPPAPATSSASPSASPSPSATQSASSSSLSKVVMTADDVEKTDLTIDGDGVEKAPKGDDISVATFDYCGGTFRMEGSREERYAVTAGITKPQLGAIFNEVVRYSSASDARAALEEFRTAVSDCDGGTYPSVLNDGEDVTFKPQQGPTSVDELDNNNTVVQTRLQSGGDSYNLTTFVAQYDDTLVITHGATKETAETPFNKAIGTVGALVGRRV